MDEAGLTSHRKAVWDDGEEPIHILDLEAEYNKKNTSQLGLRRWITRTSGYHWAFFGFVVGASMIFLFWNVGRRPQPSFDVRDIRAITNAALERTLGPPDYSMSLPESNKARLQLAKDYGFSDTTDFLKLLEERAINRKIVLMVATSSFRKLMLNLLCSLEMLRIANFAVGALDTLMFKELKTLGYPVFPAFKNSVLGGDELKSAWDRRESFHRVNVVKEEVIVWALEAGYEVILTDADIVWRRNPFMDLTESCLGFNYCFQTAIINEIGDSELNGGFIYVKPTISAIIAQKMLVVILSKQNIYLGDQQEFRKLLCGDAKRASNITCEDTISGAKTKMLSMEKYGKSAQLFNASSTRIALERLHPFTMHYNSGLPEKKERIIRDQGLWNLDENGMCLQ